MKISYGKCVQTKRDISAVVNALKEGTQMGKNTRKLEKNIIIIQKKTWIDDKLRFLCIINSLRNFIF